MSLTTLKNNQLQNNGKGEKENKEFGWNYWRPDLVDFIVTDVLSTSESFFANLWSALDLYCAKYLLGVWREKTRRTISLFDLRVIWTCLNLLANILKAKFKYGVSYRRTHVRGNILNWAL